MSAVILERLSSEHETYVHQSFLFAIALGKGAAAATEIRQRLDQLATGLMEHLADEEEIFFPWIVDRLPDRSNQVRALAHQHVELARILSDLRSSLDQSPDRVELTALELAKRFVRLLDAHTDIERQLEREARTGT